MIHPNETKRKPKAYELLTQSIFEKNYTIYRKRIKN